MVFLASTHPNNNIFDHSAAMKGDDREKFLISMKDEIDRLIEHDVFELVDKDTIPPHCKILRAIWAHRCKTTPSDEVYKHKSWIYNDGSKLEKGIDFDKTFSPVVTRYTVWLLLILSLTKQLKMRQVDYVQ